MQQGQINPEKITHPFQLMAAWFVMLIFLDGIFLTAAGKIQNPAWIAPFLAISSVVLALVVMLAVFLMLTRFRPHLQGAREYAKWLQDERRFLGQTAVAAVAINKTYDEFAVKKSDIQPPVDFAFFREIMNYPVQVSNLPEVESVIESLQKEGFRADTYQNFLRENKEVVEPARHEAIWIGARVPARVVVLAIKTVIRTWPHLKYMHLSSDGGDPPDLVHDQLYFGGATSTARTYKLKAWTLEEMNSLPENPDQQVFRKMIRAKYEAAA